MSENEMINLPSPNVDPKGKARTKNGEISSVYFDMPETCEKNGVPSLNGHELLDHTLYLDLPDPIISRATSAIEEALTVKLAREEIRKPLTKTYCQIGVRHMVVDYAHALDDDSVNHQSLRAVYAWVIDGENAGWQISRLGRFDICARQRDPISGQCL
jgi:hypothetical protein